MDPVQTTIGRVVRDEGAKMLATVIRACGGDFDLAEDALQDATAKAVEAWTEAGVPDRPAAWIVTTAKNRAIDIQRRKRLAPRATAVLPEVADEAAESARAAVEGALDQAHVPDDRLRLLFTCCHPALAREAQVALALRTLCGLSTAEIARAFLEVETTTAQRLVRAKKKIREAGIPYEVPAPDMLPERLEGVLAVIYLVFNEGYVARAGDALDRGDLATEAVRLGRLVAELLPDRAEALGLAALVLLHDARRHARIDAEGHLVTLEEQDRSRWDQAAIAEGVALLDRAIAIRVATPATSRQGPAGVYQLQAAIAALHAQARRAEDTDWRQIAALYGALVRVSASPVAELNAAVAVAMADGFDRGLAWIDRLVLRPELSGYHLVHAARADLLRRAGRTGDACDAYDRALSLVTNGKERAYLERRRGEVARAQRTQEGGR
jgi:RNA polymerase sigma-70 factor (ECF subfamily)